MLLVADFAVKTGDYHSLSKTDLKLIALAKMLDNEAKAAAELQKKENETNSSTTEQNELSLPLPAPAAAPAPISPLVPPPVPPIVSSSSSFNSIPVAGNNSSSAILSSSNNNNKEAESRFLQENDDGQGWVGPSNFHSSLSTGDDGFITVTGKKNNNKGKAEGKTAADKKKKQLQLNLSQGGAAALPLVALFTTDFTMQNLLLQMNLSIISADGLQVRSVRKFVLRCMACFTVHTKDMEKRLFCSRCGSNLLSRISCSVEEGGELKLHFKKNYTQDTRGQKYSLPAPGKQDRFSGELLLREDQLLTGIWRQKVVKINKDIKSAFGEDVTSDVGLQLNKQERLVVGWGKGNPNARRGRERRGKGKTNN
jgi:RNA-binding protein NOB1